MAEGPLKMAWRLNSAGRLETLSRGTRLEIEKEGRGYRLHVDGKRAGYYDTEAEAQDRAIRRAKTRPRKLDPARICPGPHAEGDRRSVWAKGLCYFHYRQTWDGKPLSIPASWGGYRWDGKK